MRLVLQRVDRAAVDIGEERVGEIARGLLLLVGFARGDMPLDAEALADRVVRLRVFEDAEGRMQHSAMELGHELLVVSQFTLLASTARGRRPSFERAAPPEVARELYDRFVERLRASGLRVATGRFGARMEVTSVNAGPVTLILESDGGRPQLGGGSSA